MVYTTVNPLILTIMPRDLTTSWQAEPNRRGTLNIVIACFTTLAISVWSSLHLSIPVERPNWMGELKRRLFWSLLGVLLPEVLIMIALRQFYCAQEMRDEVNKRLGFSAHRSWYQRWFFASADTRLVTRRNLRHQPSVSSTSSETSNSTIQVSALQTVRNALGENIPRKHSWTIAHGFYVTMGGFAIGETSLSGTRIDSVLSPVDFLDILDQKPDLIPRFLPDISEDDVYDKGHSDVLTKALLLIQVGWFCINCISRLIQYLPLTLLEVTTVAHAMCSIVVYIIWWKKPLNVTGHTIISLDSLKGVVIPKGACSSSLYRMEVAMSETIISDDTWRFTILNAVSGLIYSIPYALAWNTDFATPAERTLWRLCSLISIIVPCCLVALLRLVRFLDQKKLCSLKLGFLMTLLIICCGMVYFSASLYLIAASLRQLFYLPQDAFTLGSWSEYLPHIS